MISEYNRKSFYWGVPGIILQTVGFIVVMNYTAKASTLAPQPEPLSITLMRLLTIVGTVLLLVGLIYYAMAKGRSAAWCLFAFLPLIGIFVLAFLKDKVPTSVAAEPAQPRTSGLATYSLLLSIGGLFTFGLTSIPGLITGIMALRKIRQNQETLKGKGLAITGIVISSIWLALILLIFLLFIVIAIANS